MAAIDDLKSSLAEMQTMLQAEHDRADSEREAHVVTRAALDQANAAMSAMQAAIQAMVVKMKQDIAAQPAVEVVPNPADPGTTKS